MLDVAIKTEFWSIKEQEDKGSDNDRLFTIVKEKSMEECRTGEKSKKQRTRDLERSDLVELRDLINAALVIIGGDR
jgi:hypothetical protein